MDMTTDEMNPIVKKVLESKEFRRAVQDIVEGMNISADNIEDLSDAVESVINHGSFDAETSVSFTS